MWKRFRYVLDMPWLGPKVRGLKMSGLKVLGLKVSGLKFATVYLSAMSFPHFPVFSAADVPFLSSVFVLVRRWF